MSKGNKQVDQGARSFRVDARMLISLGRESIKDHTTALIELVKNAYDADAGNVEVELPSVLDASPTIRIADDGHGMSSEDINAKWLRIGYSDKRDNRKTGRGRRRTGEKGIGRLSADRLGAQIELRSQTTEDNVGIEVDWDSFDVDGADISAIHIRDIASPRPKLPLANASVTGTELIIKNLRQDWTAEDVRHLEVELSTLVPPGGQDDDFKIWLRTEGEAQFSRLSPPFQADAELEFEGSFDAKGHLTYVLTARPLAPGKERHQLATGKTSWDQLHGGRVRKEYGIGRVKVNLKFFLRAGIKIEGFSLDQLKDYLDTYGGVRLYRDNIRVKPYGDPERAEGDWLGLSERKSRNPAGASRKDFRVAANQIVGAVFIGRDANPELKDSAAREGLVHGDGYSQLRTAVYSCVSMLETYYHQKFVAKKESGKAEAQEKLPTVVEEIKSGLAEVRKAVEDARREATGGGTSPSKLFAASVAKIEEVAQKVAMAERGIEELANQAVVYRGLATVGISSAVFGHETESSLAQAKISAGVARKALNRENPKVKVSIDELDKVVRSIDRVTVWGQFALARVKKDKRRRIKADAAKIARDLADEMKPLFSASSISLRCKANTPAELRMFPMDVEALILNLLTNAYHAAGASKKSREVLIEIKLDKKVSPALVLLTVDDSGPGVIKENVDQIWVPLFSTRVDDRGKPAGTGLGLTIVKSIASEMNARVSVSPKGPLGGARFEVAFPMGGV